MNQNLKHGISSSRHEELLRRAIELSAIASRTGDHPFGALLADENGNIVLEAQATTLSDGAATSHAEQNLVTQASRKFNRGELAQMTLYSSCEPCAMCAGGIFFSGVRKVVYGLSAEKLVPFWVTETQPTPALLEMSCRAVFDSCRAHPTTVVGPLLEDEAAVPHESYWDAFLRR